MAAAERRRVLGKTVRERLAEIAQTEAERIARVYLEAMQATDHDANPEHRVRVRAADGLLAQACGRPPLSVDLDKTTETTIVIQSEIDRRACALVSRCTYAGYVTVS